MPKPHWMKASTRTSGAQMGERAITVYVCTRCGVHHERPNWLAKDKRQAPVHCMDATCGNIEFIRFQSRVEAQRYAYLRRRERLGEIEDLQLQVPFDLLTVDSVNGLAVKFGVYVADFQYFDLIEDRWVIEDQKAGNAMDAGAKLKLRIMEVSGRPVTVLT